MTWRRFLTSSCSSRLALSTSRLYSAKFSSCSMFLANSNLSFALSGIEINSTSFCSGKAKMLFSTSIQPSSRSSGTKPFLSPFGGKPCTRRTMSGMRFCSKFLTWKAEKAKVELAWRHGAWGTTDGMNAADAVLLGGDRRELRLAVQRQIYELVLAGLALQNFTVVAQWRQDFAGVQRLAAVITSNDEALAHQNANIPSSRQLQDILEWARRFSILR